MAPLSRDAQPGKPRIGARLAVLAVGVLALLFTAGTLLAPVLEARGHPGGGLFHLIYAPVCHQMPERSLAIGGLPMGVCSRCVGMYLGGAIGLIAAGLLLSFPLRLRPRWFVVALAPTALDAAAGLIGLPSLSNLPRFTLAAATGTVLGMFLAVAVADLASIVARRRAAGWGGRPAGSRANPQDASAS